MNTPPQINCNYPTLNHELIMQIVPLYKKKVFISK